MADSIHRSDAGTSRAPPRQGRAGRTSRSAGQATISPELRALAAKDDLVRMEVILVAPPVELDKEWRRSLRRAAPDALIEGRIGSTVTVKTKAKNALALAAGAGDQHAALAGARTEPGARRPG